MANIDNPHGLAPCGRGMSGGELTLQKLSKLVGTAGAIFIFDPVARDADGSISKTITPGTTPLAGVALNHGPTLVASDHLVIVSPDAVFEAQDNGETDGFAAVDMGLNCNLENNAGNALSKLSGTELDESTALETATLDVHMIQLYRSIDNAYGSNARVEVIINNHRMNPNRVGVLGATTGAGASERAKQRAERAKQKAERAERAERPHAEHPHAEEPHAEEPHAERVQNRRK